MKPKENDTFVDYKRKEIMLIRIYPENPNPREMAKALKMLRDGELIIYPTDTVYAIGCDALNVRAVEKICALKGVNLKRATCRLFVMTCPISANMLKSVTPLSNC